MYRWGGGVLIFDGGWRGRLGSRGGIVRGALLDLQTVLVRSAAIGMNHPLVGGRK